MTQSSSASSSAVPGRTPLYIFTTSQNPLTARYPRPSKPTLIVPPLIHRSLHQALDQTPPSFSSITDGSGVIIPHPDSLRKHDVPAAPEHDELEITLKLHLVGEATAQERSGWVEDALALLDRHLGLRGADTLLIGFKGVDYKGKKTVENESESFLANGSVNGDSDVVPPSEYSVDPQTENHIVDFWTRMTDRLKQGERKVKRVGTMYMPLGLLRSLKSKGQEGRGLDLEINSLDTPDCHHLPKDYTAWAREHGVQLWAGGGGEGSDPSPSAELHNILQEFVQHLLPNRPDQPLSRLIPLDAEGRWDDTARRGVSVKWVLGYTVVSSSRNVVEDKGYVVASDLLA